MTKQTAPEEKEEKVLISDNVGHAEGNIEIASNTLPLVNEVVTLYNALGFDRKLSSEHDLRELAQEFDAFIRRERENKVPDQIAGVKIDKAKFLTVAEEPAGLDELRAKAEQLRSHRWGYNLFRFDESTGQFFLCSQSCDKYRENHRSYARGKQIEAIRIAEKIAESLNELLNLGYPFVDYTQVVDGVNQFGAHKTGGIVTYIDSRSNHSGKPYFKVANLAFCLKVRVE